MKKISVSLCALAMVVWFAGAVGATPVNFNVATAPLSSVTLSNVSPSGWTSLQAGLVYGLGNNVFTLADGQTRAIDFFYLRATGLGGGTADVTATLAFDSPLISASGQGDATWGTIGGVISGGTLNWDDSSLPDVMTLADGNRVSIDFEEGVEIGFGNIATVHAYITNLGNATAPVPEPGTIVLLGAGLVGLGVFGRRRMKIQN
ncbi:MAG: PEP-CTERM sorting domain-containing protein [Geobacteraceae bacterium]|nr:PEP-CTERM sorting domain-containing protein [Geobacteraceae bacterium]